VDHTELEKATLDALVDMLAPKLRELIHRLLRRGASIAGLRDSLVKTTRKMSGKRHTFTELSICEYLDRVERGEIKIPPADAAGVQPTKESQP